MSARRLIAIGLLPLLLLLAMQVMAQWRDGWYVFDGRLTGPDAYMRNLRVERLVDTGAWYDSSIPRSNTPYGEVLHWSRPLDILIVAGAAPLAAFTGWHDAIFVSGAMVSPLLHVAALLVLLWAARPLLSEQGLMLLGVLFAAQFYIVFQFAFGRPDHHGLILLLDIWLMGLALRLAAPGPDLRLAALSGAVAALGIWVSVEGLVAAMLTLAVPTVCWLRQGRPALRPAWIQAVALLVGLGLALAVERSPSAFGDIEMDKISLVHLLFGGLAVAFWSAVGAIPTPLDRPALRPLVLLAGAAISLFILHMVFPQVLAGPMAAVEPRVVAEWYHANKEVSPLLDPADLPGTLPKAIAHLGMVLLALPMLVLLLRRSHGGERAGWLVIVAGAAVSLPLALHEVRWTGFAQIWLLVPYAACALALIRRLGGRPGGLALRALTPIVFAIGFLILGALLQRPGHASTDRAAPDCDLKSFAGELDAAYPQPRRIAGLIFAGPELLYRTHHDVIATPYHRNGAGMLDLIDLLRADDPEAARRIAKARGIDLIAVCLSNSEADRYRRAGARPSLLTRLETGDSIPDWIGTPRFPALAAGRALIVEIRP